MTTLDFKARAARAIRDPKIAGGLQRVKSHFVGNRLAAAARFPAFEDLRDRAAAIRRRAVARMPDLLEQFEASARAAGAAIHWAADSDEARTIVLRICAERGVRRVIKSKSMATEEVELNAHLSTAGIEPIETDLGEYIIQLRGEKPSHIIAPAIHLSKQDVADTFRLHHTELDPARDLSERSTLVREARAKLREAFLTADAGITGGNMMVAETGSIILVSNEGNIDLTATAPRLHIALVGIEKIVETWDEAGIILRVLARSATGQDMSSYVTCLTGVAQAGEDGPRESHIILLDNGRSAVAATDRREILNCIRCGACLNHCPIYQAIGGHAYGGVYSGPMGAVLTPAIDGLEANLDLPHASSFCGRCEEVCPVRIPLPKLLRHWREDGFARHLAPRGERVGLKMWSALAGHPFAYRMAQGTARLGLGMLAWFQGGRVTRLPVVKGFTASRTLAPPKGGSFQSRWKGRR